MKRHNNIFILKSLFWHIQRGSVFTSTSFLEGNDLIKISNSSWGTKISGFHQNIISQKKAGLTTRLQWEFVATKNFIILGSLHPFVNLRWIHKGQDQPVKCAGRVPKLPGRFGKRTTKKNKILWSKCLHCIRKGWNIPSVWSHAAVNPDKLATTPATPWPAIWMFGESDWCYRPGKGAVPRHLIPLLLKLQMETALMGCSTSSKPWDPSPSGMGKRNGS